MNICFTSKLERSDAKNRDSSQKRYIQHLNGRKTICLFWLPFIHHYEEFPVDSYQVTTYKYQFKYLNIPPNLGQIFTDTHLKCKSNTYGCILRIHINCPSTHSYTHTHILYLVSCLVRIKFGTDFV